MITDSVIQCAIFIAIVVQLVNWVLDIVYIVQRPCDSIMMTLLYVYFGYDISTTLVEIVLYRFNKRSLYAMVMYVIPVLNVLWIVVFSVILARPFMGNCVNTGVFGLHIFTLTILCLSTISTTRGNRRLLANYILPRDPE